MPGMVEVVKSAKSATSREEEREDHLGDPLKKSNWSGVKKDVGHMRKGEKTETRIGATLARRMDKQDAIGDPETYMTTPEIDGHLSKFKGGGHAFINPWVHGNIMKAKDAGGWGGWGRDSNFIAPLSEANALVDDAQASSGIALIEERLGIPQNGWNNPEKTLYRYILKDPSQFGLRVPSGRETGAYKEEWVGGGNTLGGASEAVVDSLGLADLQSAIASGAIEVRPVVFPTSPDTA